MTKHRSISQRLARAGSLGVKTEIALDWAQSWHTEQMQLIHRLEQAIKKDDYDELCIVCGQIKAVSEKRFKALPKVLTTLSKGEKE